MAGTFIKIEGLDKTLARFDIKKFEPQVQKCFNDFGVKVRTTAVETVAGFTDESGLIRSIFHDPVPLGVMVGASINYASYLEFGTRKFAAAYVNSLPAQWKELAARSKGRKGGSFDEMVKRITGWVIRKGIAATPTKSGNASKSKSAVAAQHQTAYLIARSILINGIKAQPYLYPAVQQHTKQLLADLNKIKL